MSTYTGSFSVRPHTLRLEVQTGSQDVAGNYSDINWQLYVDKTPSYAPYGTNGTWSVNIGGDAQSGSMSYDFRNYSTLLLASGTTRIYHRADGTMDFGVSASGYIGSAGGSASLSGTYYPATIPRASTPSLASSPAVAGSAVTINTNPASGSFTHNLRFAFGSQSGSIATGVGGSTTWTPALALLNEIPNALSGTGTITCDTFSGGTYIGSKTINFTLAVPSTALPTIASISCSEAVSAVNTAVGAYVQGLSQLNLAIVGAAGIYGSTISSYNISVAGQVIGAQSGTTAPITSSGTITISATVIDSRGLVGTASRTISVLPYAPPSIDTGSLMLARCLVDGTLNEEGTYVKVTFTAAVQSLSNGTQKNALRYRISSRQNGQTVYTQIIAPTAPGGITFTGSRIVGTYAVDKSWDFLIEAIDIFATSAVVRTVATSTIFMDWHGTFGVGIGKYHENGALDVRGDIYQGGYPVVDFNDSATTSAPGIVQLAGASDTTSTSKAVTPGGLLSQLIAISAQNKIINGSFRTNQRGYISGTNITPFGGYCFDRWKASGVTNLITNPSAEGALPAINNTGITLTKDTSWSQFRSSSFKMVGTGSNDSFMALMGENAPPSTFGLVAGKTYTISGYCKVITPTSGTALAPARVRGITVLGTQSGVAFEVNSSQAVNTAGVVTRVSATFNVPAGTTGGVYIRVYLGTTAGTVQWDGLMLTEGTSLYSYFDGSMSDCSWSGAADASTSYSTPNVIPTLTFAPDPNFGQTVTLNTNARIGQIVERAKMPAGTYTFMHSQSAQMRVYNNTLSPSSRPAFQTGPFTFIADGADDVYVEFSGGASGATIGQVRMYAGSSDFGFALPNLDDELRACRRYYQRLAGGSYTTIATGISNTATVTTFHVPFQVPMRVVPALESFSNLIVTDRTAYDLVVSAILPSAGSTDSEYLYITHASGAAQYRPGFLAVANSTNGYLSFDAELR